MPLPRLGQPGDHVHGSDVESVGIRRVARAAIVNRGVAFSLLATCWQIAWLNADNKPLLPATVLFAVSDHCEFRILSPLQSLRELNLE